MMERQGSLFEESPGPREQYGFPARRISRKTDPVTSHSAAADIESQLGDLQKLFMRTIREMYRIRAQSYTANEVAKAAYQLPKGANESQIGVIYSQRESLRKRAFELVELKHLVKRSSRPCEAKGRTAATYEPRN